MDMLTFEPMKNGFMSIKNDLDERSIGFICRNDEQTKWQVHLTTRSFYESVHFRQIANILDILNSNLPQDKSTQLNDNADALADMMERGPIPLHVSANRVCKDIPDGFVITIAMKNGSAWVELINSNGAELTLPDAADKSIDEQVNDALCTARLSAGQCTD